MAEVIIMPKLGFNMDEGQLNNWNKNEGERVAKGEVLFEIQTDKTSIEIEATGDGVVRRILVSAGTAVPVTTPIAIIGEADEDISKLLAECSEELAKAGLGVITDAKKEPVNDSATAQFNDPMKDMTDFDYDVAVIGAGPGGYVAAIKAAQYGMKVCIIEEARFGGVCLNEGCIPTKALIQSVKALGEVKKSAEFGVVGLEKTTPKIDMQKVQERKKTIVKQLTGGVQGLLKANGITIYQARAALQDQNTIQAGDNEIKTKNIIIATGSSVFMPPIQIDKGADVITSREALDMVDIPESIVIVGGGVIGVEFAFIYANLGAKVTIIELMDRILPMVDEEVTKEAKSLLESLGVQIITEAKVKRISDKQVMYELDSAEHQLASEKVLVAVGRVPNTEGLNAEKAGLIMDRQAIRTDEYLRTNRENIYAIGDVNGRSMLAHTASMEGVIAVENIRGKNIKMNYDNIPSCIYLQPEIASVGLTESQAREKYGEIKVGKFKVAANGKALVEGETAGLIKVISEPRLGEILGVHIMSVHATELISEVVSAKRLEATTEEICLTVHPHPTISEITWEAFNAALFKAVHSH